MGQNDIIIVAAGLVGFIAAYTGNIGGFRTWLEQFASGQGPTPPTPTAPATCSQLCARRECSTYRNRCDPAACPNCNCAKLCSAAQCGTFRAAGCNPASCTGCAQQLGSKCPYAGCTNMIPGPGCFQCRCSIICKSKPNTYAVTDAKGSCHCRAMTAKQAFAYAGFDNVTIA